MGASDSSSETAPLYPRVFGKYLLLAPLGQGGMGEVHLAKHTGLAGIERHCVIKTLRPQHAGSGDHLTRFLDEARTAVKLTHKNICSVNDVGEVGDQVFLAMDYISGRDLATVRKALAARVRALSRPLAFLIAHELLEALDFAHRKRDPATGEPLHIVHRDVSPQNVMVSFEGEVKLIDFGLAGSRLKSGDTDTGHVVGKLAYMAPEHARGERAEAPADQFSVGVMLYELLTGARYYDGMTQVQIWQVAGRGDYVPKHWAKLDAELRRVLGRALHPVAASRYETCADFRRAIDAFAKDRGETATLDELRSLLEDLFPHAEQEERTRFQLFRDMYAPVARHDDPEEAATQPVPRARVNDMPVSAEGQPLVQDDDRIDRSSLTPAEMTEDLTMSTLAGALRAPVAPAVRPLREDADDPYPVESTPPASRARWWVAGAVALVAVGIAVAVPLASSAEERPSEVIIAPLPAEEPPPPAESPPDVQPPTEPAPPTEVADEPPEVAADPPVPPKPSAVRSTRKPPAPKPRRPKPSPGTSDTPPPPTTDAPPPRPAQPLKSAGAKVRFLRKHCKQRVSCAATVIDQASRLAELEVLEMRAFNQELDACVARCQR